MKLRAVTSLYDIKRATNGDGRSIADYLAWLNRTLRLPVPFTIFLDPGIDPSKIALKTEDEIVVLPFSDLLAVRWLPRIEEICRDRAKFPASEDLNYRLPAYGPLMMSKFEFLERTEAAHPEDEHLLWIDGGISRFTPYDMAELRLRTDYLDRVMRKVDLLISARHHLRDYVHGRPHPYFPGRCQTLTIGAMFVVSAGRTAWLRELVFAHIEREWLAKQVWDTEQTALGELILGGELKAAIQDESGYWLMVLAALFEPTKHVPLLQRWERTDGFWRSSAWSRWVELTRLRLFRAYRAARYKDGDDEVAAYLGGK